MSPIGKARAVVVRRPSARVVCIGMPQVDEGRAQTTPQRTAESCAAGTRREQ